MMHGPVLLCGGPVCLLFAMPPRSLRLAFCKSPTVGGMDGAAPSCLGCLARFLQSEHYLLRGFSAHGSGLLEAARVFQRNRLHGAEGCAPSRLAGLFMAAALSCPCLGELGGLTAGAPPASPHSHPIYNLLHYGASQEVASSGSALPAGLEPDSCSGADALPKECPMLELRQVSKRFGNTESCRVELQAWPGESRVDRPSAAARDVLRLISGWKCLIRARST